MSIYSGRGVWVAEPHNVDPQQLAANMRKSGFTYAILLGQQGDEVAHEMDLGRFVSELGFPTALWVDLEIEAVFDMVHAAVVTGEILRHHQFQGIVVDAEAMTLQRSSDYLTHLLHPFTDSLALSTLPTFESSAVIRQWNTKGAWVMPQTYFLENHVVPVDAKRFLYHPPLYVGWWYLISLARGLKWVQLERQEDDHRYRLRSGRERWVMIDTPKERIIVGAKDNVPRGSLIGVWYPDKWAPTIRTTPVDGQILSVPEIRLQLSDAGNPPFSIYLGETTPSWDSWR